MSTSRTIAVLTAAAGLVLSTCIAAAGRTPAAPSPADSTGLEGAWQVTVDPAGPPPPFASMLAFDRDGVVTEATSRAPSSAGLGAWQRTGGRTFSMTFTKYRFDPTGAFAGTTVVTEQLTLTGPSSYAGSAVTRVVDPAGNEVTRFASTSQGTRVLP